MGRRPPASSLPGRRPLAESAPAVFTRVTSFYCGMHARREVLAPVRAIAFSLRSNCSLARATWFEESVIATPSAQTRALSLFQVTPYRSCPVNLVPPG